MTGRNSHGEAPGPASVLRHLLVRQLLAAAGTPQQWRPFLEALRQALGASSVQMLVVDTGDGRPHKLVSAQPEHETRKPMQQAWSRGNSLTKHFTTSPAGTLITCGQLEARAPEGRRGSPSCPEHAGQPGMRYWLFGCLFVREHIQVQLWCHRATEQGPFEEVGPSWLEELLGLTEAALTAQWRWMHRSAVLEGAVHAAQRGLLPFLLCDPEGRIHYRAPGLSRESLAALGVRISKDRLVFRNAPLRRSFREKLAEVLDAPQPQSKALVHTGAEFGESGHELWIMTLNHGTGETHSLWPEIRLAALYVYDRNRDVPVEPEPLARLFGLSPAEARLAAELARGCNLETIARNHGHSPHTVRKQLKSVFRKTGVNRQADLASLILRSPAAGAASGGD